MLCLYLPYQAIWDTVPANELQKLKESEKLGKRREGFVYQVGQTKGVD